MLHGESIRAILSTDATRMLLEELKITADIVKEAGDDVPISNRLFPNSYAQLREVLHDTDGLQQLRVRIRGTINSS